MGRFIARRIIQAIPTKTNQFVQTAVFRTGRWFTPEDRIPRKIYFDMNQPPPAPSSVRPGVDPALEKICLRALAKQPGDRFPSMKAFADALGDYARGAPATEPTPKASVPGETTDSARMLAEIVASAFRLVEAS